jgi:type I restriction enzyme M protein
LRKFAEGSGQSAGEFFTPTEVGFLMAHIMRPKPGEDCHDYACGSAGLLVKLQLSARELDPTRRVPLKLYGQELTAESYTVAQMNAIIHDMSVEIARRHDDQPETQDRRRQDPQHDIIVANPMWNQPFNPDIFADDPFDRFRTQGGLTTGKGDWAWLQHTLACLDDRGRAAVVLDTGAVTRGSGSKNEDKERNIRKWFVDRDLIDGVILLPDNLFYNTTAAGVIVVLSKRKPTARKAKIVLLNASRRVAKGRPKNFIPESDIRPLAAAYLKGEPVEGEIAIITRQQAEDADYNLSLSRWVGQSDEAEIGSIAGLLHELKALHKQDETVTGELLSLFAQLMTEEAGR